MAHLLFVRDAYLGYCIKSYVIIAGPFIHISGQKGVYFSERWEPNGSTLYLPVDGSLLTNIDKYDQISFEQGLFFIGDISGAFQQKAQGTGVAHAVHFLPNFAITHYDYLG